MDIADYVRKHTEQIEQPEEGSINMEFFHVKITGTPDAETFIKLSNECQGEFCASSPFDGHEQNYMKLGGWIGDQGLAMMYMALGTHLGLFQLLTPTRLMPMLDAALRKHMAGQGMVAIIAKPKKP